MVAYSFKARFAPPILAGAKRQTIRGGRKRHARPGEQVQLFTGMRTKHCKKIGTATCVSVCDITLHFLGPGRASLHDDKGNEFDLKGRALEAFAQVDGFADWEDMKAFWKAEHPGLDTWDGVVIAWVDLR